MPTTYVRRSKIISIHDTDIEKVTVTNSKKQFQTLSERNMEKQSCSKCAIKGNSKIPTRN